MRDPFSYQHGIEKQPGERGQCGENSVIFFWKSGLYLVHYFRHAAVRSMMILPEKRGDAYRLLRQEKDKKGASGQQCAAVTTMMPLGPDVVEYFVGTLAYVT